ncbi:MAG: phosphate/phosphite/phosphonate ABC transporter substrate-binding protein [bacterium]|nr:phosphate/phosphite/phosphonate ABC transporter substrate-binding protein [bacterium]
MSILLIFSACQESELAPYEPQYSNSAPNNRQTLTFGVHPLHNPLRLHEIYGPLVDRINSRLPRQYQLQLEASASYASFEAKLKEHHLDFALPNPLQTLMAIDCGYSVFAKMGDDEEFRGIILTRRDSGINSVAELKGKKVSFPAPTALAATIMPQLFLESNGLHVVDDIESLYVGSQESSMMSVYMKESVAGATWPPPWKNFVEQRPGIAAELQVSWSTEPLINNGLVVLPEVPDLVQKIVREEILALQQDEQGKDILSRLPLSKFEEATNDTYERVREYIAQFEVMVRPIDSAGLK